MRIIAGRYRARKLKGPRDLSIRPTQDRLKESLFGILGDRVQDARFLDVFAGTGSIGLEAFSRGAREVVFVDSSPVACQLITDNIMLCGMDHRFRIIGEDVFRALRGLRRETQGWDVIFLDPPYGWNPYADLLEIIFGSELAGVDSLIVIEHHRKTILPRTGAGFIQTRW